MRKQYIKDQRKELNYFFIASSVYYIFLLIFCMCLVPIAYLTFSQLDGDMFGFRIFADSFFFIIIFICTGTGSLIYAVKRIHWLLGQKDQELQVRSRRAAYLDQGIIDEHAHNSINSNDVRGIGDTRTESYTQGNRIE